MVDLIGIRLLASMFVASVVMIAAVTGEEKSRRLVLHSDIDVAEEILAMKEQMAGLEAQVDDLSQQLKIKDTEIQLLQGKEAGGSSYIRWGRTSCASNGSSLVYSGYMAGTQYETNTGNGGSYLCLTDEPSWDHYVEGEDNQIRITAIEYHFCPHCGTSTVADFLGNDVYNHDALCSLCTVSRSVTVMIPGRNTCYPGWTLEYQGYLVGPAPSYADASEYICLDRRPESLPGSGNRDPTFNSLYFVEAHCGDGLECPPYIGGRELTCVVCSK